VSIQSPNYTQIPNEILDKWMCELNGSELKILLKICRNTLGWNKKKDKISITQLEKSTGLSRPQIISATKKLIEHDLIICISNGQKIKEFEIKIEDKKEKNKDNNDEKTSKETLPHKDIVNKINQTSKETLLVGSKITLHTKEKDKINNTKEKDCGSSATSNIENLILSNESPAFSNVKKIFADGYLEIHNENIADWPKQVKSIEKILKFTGDDPILLYEKLKIYKDLIMNPSNLYWQDMKFTPNHFVSNWDNLTEKKPILSKQQIRDKNIVENFEKLVNNHAKQQS